MSLVRRYWKHAGGIGFAFSNADRISSASQFFQGHRRDFVCVTVRHFARVYLVMCTERPSD